METQRICMTLDLDALTHNIRVIRSHMKEDARLFAVIKCDAYGHGAVRIARYLEEEHLADGFALATVDEALELRAAGIESLLLVLGFTSSDEYPEMIRKDIRPTLFSAEMAEAFSKAAQEVGKEGLYHIKIDTGMGRIGIVPGAEGLAEIQKMTSYPGIRAEGIFTHFARADEGNPAPVEEQYQRFTGMILALSDLGITFDIRHCANSAAILEQQPMHLDAVRAGIILYGLWPSDQVPEAEELLPVMSLHSCIVHLKTVPQGTPIGYGGTWKAPRPSVIATVPVGYGDGYARTLSNQGSVLIGGQRAPIVGRICMDQMMVDVTHISGVHLSQEVTLVGRDKEERISLEELGGLSGRFNYEFACGLGTRRIPRIFVKNGEILAREERLGLKPTGKNDMIIG